MADDECQLCHRPPFSGCRGSLHLEGVVAWWQRLVAGNALSASVVASVPFMLQSYQAVAVTVMGRVGIVERGKMEREVILGMGE